MSAGFGITGSHVLDMFTTRKAQAERLVLKAMGATSRRSPSMIFVEVGRRALLGTGLGLGLRAIIGQIVVRPITRSE